MKDKLLHFAVCFIATLAVAFAMFFLDKWPAILCGLWFGTGLAFGKEYGDSKASGDKWDWWDILADGIGVTLAVILLWWLK